MRNLQKTNNNKKVPRNDRKNTALPQEGRDVESASMQRVRRDSHGYSSWIGGTATRSDFYRGRVGRKTAYIRDLVFWLIGCALLMTLWLLILLTVSAPPVSHAKTASVTGSQPPNGELVRTHGGVEYPDPSQIAYAEIRTTTAYSPKETCPQGLIANCKNVRGKQPIAGISIACPRNLRLGTRVVIDGQTFTCDDHTSQRYDGRFDRFVSTYEEAITWGKKEMIVYILK